MNYIKELERLTKELNGAVHARDTYCIEVEGLTAKLFTTQAELNAKNVLWGSLVSERDEAKAKLAIAVKGLKEALYQLERIRDADWQAGQMRLGAKSGAYQVGKLLAKIEGAT